MTDTDASYAADGVRSGGSLRTPLNVVTWRESSRNAMLYDIFVRWYFGT